MKLSIHYGDAVTVIPAAAGAVMKRATKTDIAVLLALCTDRALTLAATAEDMNGRLAAAAGCTPAQAEASLSFWRGTGLLELCEEDSDAVATPAGIAPTGTAPTVSAPAPVTAPPVTEAPNAETDKPYRIIRKPASADSLPKYTTEELVRLLEEREEAAAYLQECQQVWGKIFSTQESNLILGLVDYLGLDWEYVLILLAWAAKYFRERENQGKSLNYVEKMAFSFHGEGIVTIEALQQKFKDMEQMASYEYKLRELFGMGQGALTPAQKKHFSTWLYEYRYDLEIIRMAYNRAVDGTGSGKISKLMSYANSVMANWNRDGLRTVEAIEAAEAAYRAEKDKEAGRATPKAPAGSFDTDDFFGAAVRRSFGDDFDPTNPDN